MNVILFFYGRHVPHIIMVMNIRTSEHILLVFILRDSYLALCPCTKTVMLLSCFLNIVYLPRVKLSIINRFRLSDNRYILLGPILVDEQSDLGSFVGLSCLASTCSSFSCVVDISQPTFSLGPLLARRRNAISMAFRLRADSYPLLDAYWVCLTCMY